MHRSAPFFVLAIALAQVSCIQDKVALVPDSGRPDSSGDTRWWTDEGVEDIWIHDARAGEGIKDLPGFDLVADAGPDVDMDAGPDVGLDAGPDIAVDGYTPTAGAWTVAAGGAANEGAYAVALDSSGNSFITGEFEGTASFGSTTLTAAGSRDVFIAKLDKDGKFLWAISAGGPSSESGSSVAVDSAGNCYVAGYFSGSATFGATSLTSSGLFDVFVTKVDKDGKFLWTTAAGGAGQDYGYGVAVDILGVSTIVGNFVGSVTFGSTTLTSDGDSDIFVARLSKDGAILWATSAGGGSADFGARVGLDGSGNAYITGFFSKVAGFGTITLYSSGFEDAYVAKVSSTGKFVWASAASGMSNTDEHGLRIAVDSAGNSYVAGVFTSQLTIGSTTLSSSGNEDLYVAKVASNGSVVWATSAGGTNSDLGYGIAVDSVGSTYITGQFQGQTKLGTFTLQSAGSKDLFVAKLDSGGKFIWATSDGGSSDDVGHGIAVDGGGWSHVTGRFSDKVTFGATPLSSKGMGDIYVTRLSPTGKH